MFAFLYRMKTKSLKMFVCLHLNLVKFAYVSVTAPGGKASPIEVLQVYRGKFPHCKCYSSAPGVRGGRFPQCKCYNSEGKCILAFGS